MGKDNIIIIIIITIIIIIIIIMLGTLDFKGLEHWVPLIFP